jgi:aryl-alcohol dehydrogenase-like predicted oxidoreductase
MPGMPGMGGMPMQGGAMMPQMMRAHMDTMMSMGADRMKAMLPMHRQMVANMLAQMNQQMQSMHMPADTKWTALADSVRQDLVRMPGMSDQALKGFMPPHQARVMRLMAMHQQMMGGVRQ